MPTSLGPAEILVILVVALVVLGPKRLPEAGRQIGRFMAEVRHWSSAVQAEIRDVIDAEGAPTPPPPAASPPAVVPPTAPTTLAPEVARRSAAAEWGLSESAPAAPPSPPSSGAIPAEWETPPSSNGDHA
jgi:sec-independent protein translocase protein TatA